MSPIEQRYAEADEISAFSASPEYAQRFSTTRIRHNINDADSSEVLALLAESEVVDGERLDELLMQACQMRMAREEETPRGTQKRALLKAMKALIDAAETTLDYSPELRGAIAKANTAWFMAGGAAV